MIIRVKEGGMLEVGDKKYSCVLGAEGVTQKKKEGDKKTPLGRFPLREVWYRADRISGLKTGLSIREIKQQDGWCDDPGDVAYNKWVRLPYFGRTESLWREDDLYDLLVVIGYNDSPPAANLGSAIFMHVAAEDGSSTAGCVAMELPDLVKVVSFMQLGDEIEITGNPK